MTCGRRSYAGPYRRVPTACRRGPGRRPMCRHGRDPGGLGLESPAPSLSAHHFRWKMPSKRSDNAGAMSPTRPTRRSRAINTAMTEALAPLDAAPRPERRRLRASPRLCPRGFSEPEGADSSRRGSGTISTAGSIVATTTFLGLKATWRRYSSTVTSTSRGCTRGCARPLSATRST
jgi:hypothetical protein